MFTAAHSRKFYFHACWRATLLVPLSAVFGLAPLIVAAEGAVTGGKQMEIVSRLPDISNLQGVAWSVDGKQLATLSKFGGTIAVWDTRNWQRVNEISQYSAAYSGDSIAWTKDGLLLASAGAKTPDEGVYSMNLWNPTTGSLVKRILGPSIPDGAWKHNQANVFVMSSSKSLLAMTLFRIHDVLVLYETKDWSIERIIDIPRPTPGRLGSASAITFSPGEQNIAIANGSYLQIIDVKSGEVKSSIVVYDGQSSQITALKFSPDGRFLASAPGLWKKSDPVRIWNASTGELVLKIPGAENSYGTLDWSPDGSRLAAAGTDDVVRVWQLDMESKTAKSIFELPDAGARVVAFGPDGSLATGSTKAAIILK